MPPETREKARAEAAAEAAAQGDMEKKPQLVIMFK